MGNKPFFKDGLRFECQGSGRCCTSRGGYGFVYLTLKDQKRMAEYFKLDLSSFRKQYTKKHRGHVALKDPIDFPDIDQPKDDCIFLKEKKCSIYEARPEHCRTWPFWPENMNPKAWNTDIAVNCPGVGKGRLYSYEEIKEILSHQE